MGERKKTLLFAPFANWGLHFETDLELAQRALDEGEELTVVYCDGELPACEPNPLHKAVMCRMCRARRNRGFRWLGNKGVRYLSLGELGMKPGEEERKLTERFKNLEEIVSFRQDGSDLGLAAVSSTVSYFREPELSLPEHGKVLRRHLLAALSVHKTFSAFLDEIDFDRVILFNGRYSSLRPLLRLAQQKDLEVDVHERGHTFGRFSLSKGVYPHAIEYVEDRILHYAHDETPDETKRALGAEWFDQRRGGVVQNWTDFTKEQTKGLLPQKFSQSDFNLVIFNSSEDEFVAIEEWKNPYYRNQNEGIRKIAESFSDDAGVRIYLRVHPNLKGIENSQTRELEILKNSLSNLTVIPADSPVNTYALMDAADLVVTFGSTAGIEAAYAGKPSVVMGRAPYLILESNIIPTSHDAMVRMVRDLARGKELPPVKARAYLYGYYIQSSGIPFRYVEQTGIGRAVMVRDGKRFDLNKTPGIVLGWIERAILKLWKTIGGGH
ncbi:capsular polysaccharide export protein, LipB/KpsS family [Hydrogenimonas sp.]